MQAAKACPLAATLTCCIAWQTYKEHVAYFAAYYRDHRPELPFIIWRDSSVQHFDTPTGMPGISRAGPSPAEQRVTAFPHADRFIRSMFVPGCAQATAEACTS